MGFVLNEEKISIKVLMLEADGESVLGEFLPPTLHLHPRLSGPLLCLLPALVHCTYSSANDSHYQHLSASLISVNRNSVLHARVSPLQLISSFPEIRFCVSSSQISLVTHPLHLSYHSATPLPLWLILIKMPSSYVTGFSECRVL